MDTSSAGAACPNQVSKKTVDREKMKDPLVHLIRNSLDHGIETPDDREAAGKPRLATVHLQAAHEQGQIVITVGDDGRGVDREAVRASAVARGALAAEAAERLGDQELLDLIFQPGLSTARTTTEISGRGVGMDIVRRDIEELNGRVDVSSTPGQGTTFTLRLPLTLATFRGLLLSCAGTMYAVPLTLVQETLRLEPGVVRYVSGRPVLHLRGTSMSLIGLDEAVRARSATERSQDYADCYVVVVRASESESDRPVAIVVDDLVDQQEVVVKTLSGYLGRARGLAGASILGDGRVVLIVDVPTIIESTLAGASAAAELERMAV